MVAYDKRLYLILGKRLQQLRKENHLTLEQVADKIGKTKKTISRYETGDHRMSIDSIKELCDVYGYNYDKLNSEVEYEFSRTIAFQNDESKYDSTSLFTNSHEAMIFLLEQPTLAAFGGYDPSKMSDDQLIRLANRILKFIKMETEDLEELNIDNLG